MFARVIVGFDGSPGAEDALALARRLHDPRGGPLTLAYVVPERRLPWFGAAHAPEEVPEDAALVLAGARARLPATARVQLRAPRAASAARGLTELAECEDADLIVVGSSRVAADGRTALGRTAHRLLQGAPCAVAVAPSGARGATYPFRHVGVAYDGSPEAAAALAAGYRVAAAAGAAVTLFQALSALEPALADARLRARLLAQEQLDAAADAAPPGVNPRTVLLHGAAGQLIREACDGVVDLVVTGSRGYGPLQRVLAGSVAEELAENATQAVLVLPRAAARVPAMAATPALAVV